MSRAVRALNAPGIATGPDRHDSRRRFPGDKNGFFSDIAPFVSRWYTCPSGDRPASSVLFARKIRANNLPGPDVPSSIQVRQTTDVWSGLTPANVARIIPESTGDPNRKTHDHS